MVRSVYGFFWNPRCRAGEAFPLPGLFPPDGGEKALAAISRCPRYRATPLVPLPLAATRAGVGEVYLKHEAERFGLGSFKALGGAYAVGRVLAEHVARLLGRPVALDELARGEHADITERVRVVCASDGNHGRAVAAGARVFHARATIFFHEGVSAGREAAVRALGADVVRTPGTYDDSVRFAAETAAREGWTVISDTADARDPDAARIPLLVMEGYRVLVMEALDQFRALGVPPPTHVFLQAGVGGLAAAVAAHLWTEFGSACPAIIVVEPELADCLMRSAAAGRPTPAPGDLDTVMAGLACGEVSQVAWPILNAAARAFMTIGDAAAIAAMRSLADGALGAPPLVAGESAVAGLAALLALPPGDKAAARLGLGPASRVLVIGTEGATDPEIYHALVGRPAETVA